MEYNRLVRALIEVLRKTRVPYMFVGGLAVNYWGFPRMTFDVDLVIALRPPRVSALVSALQRLKFEVHEDDVQLILRVGNRFMTHSPITAHRVDFWIPKTAFELEAFERRRPVLLEGRRSWLIAPEDLVVMKLLAGRGKDLEDAVSVIERQGDRLNWRHTRSWTVRLGLSDELARVRRKRVSWDTRDRRSSARIGCSRLQRSWFRGSVPPAHAAPRVIGGLVPGAALNGAARQAS